MEQKLVQVGRLVTPRLLSQRKTQHVIVDVQDDKMVVIQNAGGERKLVSVGRLYLLDDVLEITSDMSVDDVSAKLGTAGTSEVEDNDFERFKRELRTEIENDLLKNKGF